MALTKKLTAIADGFRTSRGTSDKYTLEEMAALAAEPIGGGGGDIDALIDGSITEVTSNAEEVKGYCFYQSTAILSANLPKAKTLEAYSFGTCGNLRTISAPEVTELKGYAISSCQQLNDIDLTNVQTIGNYGLSTCQSVLSLNFPELVYIGAHGLRDLVNLTEIYCPKVETLSTFAFASCRNMKKISDLYVATVGVSAFTACSSLERLDFPIAVSISNNAFENCTSLKALMLRNGNTICSLSNTGALRNTSIASGTGYIYVPRALLSDDDASKDYRRATNWSTYASQFRALEDYTVDGTITGELDESKI